MRAFCFERNEQFGFHIEVSSPNACNFHGEHAIERTIALQFKVSMSLSAKYRVDLRNLLNSSTPKSRMFFGLPRSSLSPTYLSWARSPLRAGNSKFFRISFSLLCG